MSLTASSQSSPSPSPFAAGEQAGGLFSTPADAEGRVPLQSPARRRMLRLAALTLAAPAWAAAQSGNAPTVSEVHELRGTVRVNGEPVTRKTRFKPGDQIVTGNDGYLVFTHGDDAFMLRSRSELVIGPRDDDAQRMGLFNLATGALGAVFRRKSGFRRVKTHFATIGIRGTGVYVETRGDGTYFCTCWGATDIQANDNPRDREQIESRNHTPRLISAQAVDGTRFKPAPFETHTDQEMDILEKCVGRRSPILAPDWFER
ncbi:MAG: hypothetical protein JNM76_03055 [Betaproteobacteria bacterium]|nr:hypothetical protein [Betaproteobacteria bacterium]